MRTLKSFFSYIKGEKTSFFFMLLFSFIAVIGKLGIPFLAGLLIDGIIQRKDNLTIYVVLMSSFLLVGSISRFVFEFLNARLGQKIIGKMRKEIFDSYLSCETSNLDSLKKGDLLQRLLGDVETIQTGLINGISSFFDGIATLAITIVFMFLVNYVLALVMILLSPISLLVSKKVSKSNSVNFLNQAKTMGELGSFTMEEASCRQAIDSYGIRKKREKRFDEINQRLRSYSFKAEFASAWINPSTRLINNVIYATIVLVGSLLLANKVNIGIVFTIGGLSSFLAYATQFMTPFNEISNVFSELMNALASFKRVEEAISFKKESSGGNDIFDGCFTSFEGEDIVFSYGRGKKVLDGFSFAARKGQKIAIVGKTGCGKTTLFNLLMRFYEENQGAFYVDEKDISSFSKESWRKKVGVVLQDPYLLDGTIGENIALGKEGVSLEEIKEAAKKAQADWLLSTLKDGYETHVSNSSSLSSGQKQLIAIARIFLMKPEIVLLDEATSNIDPLLEKKLCASIDALLKDKTSIVVAHRLSTIVNADVIYVMDEGKVKECGDFATLMKNNGLFASLYKSQFDLPADVAA